MKRVIYFFLFSLFCLTVSAQQTIISGVLRDSISNETEPYATIRVYRSVKTDKPVYMSTTGLDGEINQKVEGKGEFIITFSSVGKKEVRRSVTLSGEPKLDLGVVYISDDAKTLGGVEVVAHKPLVKMETDKMTYNIEDDVDSKSNTILDMLRKVPMVVVDGQDQITVNGSSSFKVYVDGKPNPMMTQNASQIFKAMPASAVKNIEVITNPGSKYDAEGTAGVLNITMNRMSVKSKDLNGFNGNITVGGNNRGARTSAFISGQQDKFTYSANGMYSFRKMDGSETYITRTQPSANGDMIMNQQLSSDSKAPFAMGNVSLGYVLDAQSSLNAMLGITDFSMRSNSHPVTSFTGGMYGDGYSYGNFSHTKNKSLNFNTAIDYQRYLNKDRSSSITFSYLYSTSPRDTESKSVFDDVAGDSSLSFDLSDRFSDVHTRGTEHTLQFDYTTPLVKGHILNLGAKYIIRGNSSDSKYYDLNNDKPVFNEKNSVNYDDSQDILAGYAEYDGHFGKLGTKAGLRYEYTWQNVDYKLGSGENFDKNYGNLVPSASISYAISQTMNIGVNYGMRISRPGISYLNPYVDNSNPTSIKYGNSNLDTEKSHSIGLVFNYFTPNFMINTTLNQTICDNKIAQYSVMSDQVLHTTYGNIVENRSTRLNTFMSWSPLKDTRILVNASVSYVDMQSPRLGLENSGWQANGFFNIQQTLPWDLRLSVGTFAKSRSKTLQGYTGTMSMFNASLNKSFLDNKFNVSLMVVTPFSDKMKIKSYSHSDDYYQYSNTAVPMQMVGVTLTYNFGNTKKKFKTHTSKIKNDFNEEKSQGEVMNNYENM